jgi:hypothetical protein
MSEWNQFDQKIADKFQGFSESPPPGIWDNIRSELDKSAAPPPTSNSFLPGTNVFLRAMIAAVLLGVISWYVFLVDNTGLNQRYQPRKGDITLIQPSSSEAMEAKNQTTESETIKAEQSENTTTLQNQNTQTGTSTVNQTESTVAKVAQQKQAPVKKDVPAQTVQEESTQLAEQKPDQKNLAVPPAEPEMREPVNTEELALQRAEISTPELEPVLASTQKKEKDAEQAKTDDKKDDTRQKTYVKNDQDGKDGKYNFSRLDAEPFEQEPSKPYSLGLYVNADQIYNTADALDGANNGYGLGLVGRYHMNKNYFVETGLGAYRTEDGWDYIVDYRANEKIGTYSDVDSISYHIVQGSNGQDSAVITYHTHEESVYDSVDRVNNDISKRQYTYLTVPLMVGYSNNFKRFKYSVSTGLIMSLVVHEKQIRNDFNQQNASIISVKEQIYNRISTNWHYSLNLGFGYQFNHRWSMMFEPELRVYLNELYESSPLNGSQKKPYSLGMRAGLYYRF